MKEKKKYIKKLERTFKNRLIGILNIIYKDDDNVSFYLSGSHNSLSDKKPTKDSDVDIYVFVDEALNRIRCNNVLSKQLKMMLGKDFQVFEIKNKYRKYVSKGMEKLN